MAIRGVNLHEHEEFILPWDEGNPEHPAFKAAAAANKPTEQPTVFLIGNMTAGDRVFIGDLTATPSMKDGAMFMTTRRISRAYEIVKRGLKGWRNMLDANGKQVQFGYETTQGATGFQQVAKEECLLHLSQEDIIALSDAILAKNGMTNALEKKLDGALQQLGVPNFEGGDVPNAPTPSETNEAANAPPNAA